jgi:hypothetical protein
MGKRNQVDAAILPTASDPFPIRRPTDSSSAATARPMQLHAKMPVTRPRRKYHDPSVLQCCGYPLSSRRVGHSVDFIFSKSVGSSIVRRNILAPPLDFRAGSIEHQKAAPALAGPDRQITAMRGPAHTETSSIQLDRRSRLTFDLPNFRGSRIISDS